MDAHKGRTARRARKLVSGLIAGAVIAFMAMQTLARADSRDEGCSRSDVAIWHLSLLEAGAPVKPGDILDTTEAFLAACPDRPEVPQAQAIAAMAAVELGDAELAMSYFDLAGQQFTLRQKLYRTATLLALGRQAEAWTARDRLVEDWLGQIEVQPGIEGVVEAQNGGRLVNLTFVPESRLDGLLQAWVALPDGPGWPASITLGLQREGNAFRPVYGQQANARPALYADLFRCRTRRMLGALDPQALDADLDRSARAALIAYLGAPDPGHPDTPGAPIAQCYWPDRLLPSPRG